MVVITQELFACSHRNSPDSSLAGRDLMLPKTRSAFVFTEGLTLEFPHVDQPMVSNNPEKNADLGLLLCE